MDYCIGTGYGRVNVPMADRTLTESPATPRGEFHLRAPGPDRAGRGGQDMKAIQCDDKGRVDQLPDE